MNARVTPRIEQFIRLTANGLPQKAIAEEMGVSLKTVSAHYQQTVSRLLGLHNAVQTTRYAIKTKLVRI